jgi:hypothetical protein
MVRRPRLAMSLLAALHTLGGSRLSSKQAVETVVPRKRKRKVLSRAMIIMATTIGNKEPILGGLAVVVVMVVVVVVTAITIASGPSTLLKKAMSIVMTRKYTCARVTVKANRL